MKNNDFTLRGHLGGHLGGQKREKNALIIDRYIHENSLYVQKTAYK